MGIIAACIPTLRPLFTRNHPWSKKGWRRHLTRDRPPSEEKHRLHNLAQRTTLPTVPLGLDSSAGKNEVAVVARSTRREPDIDGSSRDEDTSDGYGPVDEGIVKTTEFSLDSRREDDDVGWIRGYGDHAAQDAFNRV